MRRTGSTTSPTCSAMSPVLLERYLAAAGKISSLAVGDPDTRPGGRDVPHPPGRVAGHAHRRPADRHGRRHPREDDAAARRRVRLRDQAVPHEPRRRARPRVRASARIHGGRRARASVEGRRRRRLQGQPQEHDEGRRRRRGAGALRMPLKAGPHVITAAFLERSDAVNPLRLQPFIRSSNDTLDTIGHPHLDTFTLTGSVQRDGAGRHAEPAADLRRAGPPSRDAEDAVRAPDHRDAGAPRVSRAGRAAPTSSGCSSSIMPGRKQGTFETRHPDGAAARFWPARSSPSASSAIRRALAAGHGLPHQRPRARVAAVVLPVEQHSRRSAAARRRAGHAAHAGRAEPAGAAHAGRSEGATRWSTTSPASGSICAT